MTHTFPSHTREQLEVKVKEMEAKLEMLEDNEPMSYGHTRGPWTTNGFRRVESEHEHGEVNDGWIICNCDGSDAEANAHLIAAAPDLLEACERLLKFNEELCEDVGVSKHYPSADFARAAIAKARGVP